MRRITGSFLKSMRWFSAVFDEQKGIRERNEAEGKKNFPRRESNPDRQGESLLS